MRNETTPKSLLDSLTKLHHLKFPPFLSGHFKTGQRNKPETMLFYLFAS